MIPFSNELSVTVTSGTRKCVTLATPPRGFLGRLIVRQLVTDVGQSLGFDYNLYDRKAACENETPSAATLHASIHRLQANQSVSATQGDDDAEIAQFGISVPFINRDDRDVNLGTPTYALYLDLLANSTGGAEVTRTFVIAWTAWTDMH